MKKIFILFFILLISMAYSGCDSDGSLNLIGNWSWTQQQNLPTPRENQGSMSVTGINGSQITGTITQTLPAPGGPYNFSGVIAGVRAIITYTYGITAESWTIDFLGNSFSGNWSGTDGTIISSGTINGTKTY